jgi:uncharacterized protein YbjT (DUF2867 family)
MQNGADNRPCHAVAGATGFIGRRLVAKLRSRDEDVRALVRDADRAREALAAGTELREADLETSDASDLTAALEGCTHAYFLVHLMSGENEGYAERERQSAERFADAARRAGVGRISYLGGLGSDSPHLASRQGTAEALAGQGPPLTYFRAALIVGPGSASYELLRSIVERLPVAPAPGWLDNRTQPIGVRDVIAYLAAAPGIPETAGREIQIGGPEALSHREVISELARQMGRSGPRWLPVSNRLANPGAMAAGAATVTKGDPAVAAELALGLQEDTVVTDEGGAKLFPVRPEPLGRVFQRCLEEAEDEAAREEVHAGG